VKVLRAKTARLAPKLKYTAVAGVLTHTTLGRIIQIWIAPVPTLSPLTLTCAAG
jgi:hypothetical protein